MYKLTLIECLLRSCGEIAEAGYRVPGEGAGPWPGVVRLLPARLELDVDEVGQRGDEGGPQAPGLCGGPLRGHARTI